MLLMSCSDCLFSVADAGMIRCKAVRVIFIIRAAVHLPRLSFLAVLNMGEALDSPRTTAESLVYISVHRL